MLQPTAPTLPPLRQDLRLHAGCSDGRGDQTWLIYDPVRHRYFQIEHDVYNLLRIWSSVRLDDFVKETADRLDQPVARAQVERLVQFLYANNLTETPADGDPRAYARQVEATRRSALSRSIHSYLFFRIPLVRPARFLKATLPLVSPLFSRTALWCVLLISLVGIYLASRQWEAFTTTFLDFLKLEGLLAYGLALVAIKALHELGHAYTATRYGVRVNTMGVAFMLLMPLLFTDVTDAWKLKSRRQKLAIAGAGLVVELAVAGLATFLWAFLPDGPARSAAFVLATTSWILSLAVNLNPFMRFDGYYLLADAWGMANLQTRAFAMARWWLREALFGLGHEPPEAFSPKKRRLLIFYAFGTWIYRLILFIGIALLVYHMFFKVLGVILFAIEIIWFIGLPIWKEFMEWWKLRDQIIRTRRGLLTGAILAALIAIAVIPWSGTVRLPAVIQSEKEYSVFAPRAAQVVSSNIKDGATVLAGYPLVGLRSPELEHRINTTKIEIGLSEAQLRRIAGDAQDLSNRTVIESRLQKEREKLQGLLKEQRQLQLTAPFDGQIRDTLESISVGDWIDTQVSLARVVADGPQIAVGYAHEDDVWKLAAGRGALFVPEDPLLASRRGQIRAVAKTGSRSIDVNYLSSVYGGAIPADKGPDGTIRPRSGRYMVEVALDGASAMRAVPGTLHLTGEPESFAAATWRRILQVLVRESGI